MILEAAGFDRLNQQLETETPDSQAGRFLKYES
jgi:hypothetical protein